jgi:uncharacterized protein (DUF2147 family)
MKITASLLARFALAAVIPAPAFAHEAIEGIWKNRPNTLVVRIAPCGAALCGTVVKATEDAKESVRKAGSQELVGTRVLTGMRKSSGGSYSGQVFNPNLNVHASGTVTLENPDVLVVKACVLAGLICRQQHWNRVG